MKEIRLIDYVGIGMVAGFVPTFVVSLLSVNTVEALVSNMLAGLGIGTFIGLIVGIFREIKTAGVEG